jgi:nicotinate-nucleotide adenylyltransferase
VTAIGIMGGTFDPIHFGHLRAAEEVLQGFGLDRVVFVPSGRPPHKRVSEVTIPEHRFVMTELATADHPRFEVSRIELDRDGPSYTLDSLIQIRRQIGDKTKLYFITGLDAILDVPTWHNYMELFDLADFIAVTRPGYSTDALNQLKTSLGEKCFQRIHPFTVTLLAIASRDIRRYVAKGQSIRYLVPDPVWRYILENKLYTNSDIGEGNASFSPQCCGR